MARLPFPQLGMRSLGRRFPFPRRRRADGTRRGKFRIWPILIFIVFFVVYTQMHTETVPISGRTQIVDVSRADEVALGLSSYQQIMAQSRVVRSGPEVERVREIGRRIAAVTDVSDFEWEFNLIDSPEANAFALPGGKVAIYTGILPVALNDDGLAAIMGHEIAHATSRHGAERMTHQKIEQFGRFAVGMSVGEMDPRAQQLIMGAFGIGSRFGVILPFSREHESEADYIGLLYLARACFNPREAPLLWQRMKEASGRAPAEFLSTHPSADTRIEQFQKWMPEAIQLYQQNCQ